MSSTVNKEQSNNSNNETKIQYHNKYLCAPSVGECGYGPDYSCTLSEGDYP